MKELDCVKLKKDYPKYKLKKGRLGTIVCYDDRLPNMAHVEFANKNGETLVMETFPCKDLEVVYESKDTTLEQKNLMKESSNNKLRRILTISNGPHYNINSKKT